MPYDLKQRGRKPIPYIKVSCPRVPPPCAPAMRRSESWRDWPALKFLTRRRSLPYTSSEKRSALATSWGSNHFHLLLRSRPDDMFSVEQLSSTVSEAGTNVTSDKRLRQSFYNRVDYVTNRIADELEIRRGKQFPYQCFGLLLLMTTPATSG